MSLPDQDRRDNEDVTNRARNENRATLSDEIVIWVLLGVGAASLTTEWVIGYRVFSELFAPDVPGEEAHGPAIIMSFSTTLAAAAFHLYLLKYPDTLAARLLNKCLPWLVLGFICSMALMAVKNVFDAAGLTFSGAETNPADFLSEPDATPKSSLFDRIAVRAFGAGLAGLCVSSFWLAQAIFENIWTRIKAVIAHRALARETSGLMDAINADEARVARLDAEQRALERELTPQASFEFAVELAALVQELRAPVVAVITKHHITKKSESVIRGKDQPEIELSKYKELAAVLDLTPEKIHSAFRANHEGKNK